ncbi:MAG TPA: peptidylprolyl isomerase [Blastocatellia bacterium]|nr:peptidylprolyl isomerase [Blastocatellia bacterium]
MSVTRFLSVLCVLTMTTAGGCRAGGDRSPVIASINGRDIHLAEFEQFLALKVGEFTSPDPGDSLKSKMLDEFIRRRVVLDEAARVGLTITDAEIAQATQDNPQMKSTTATATVIAREELARDLLVEKCFQQVLLKDVRVSPEEIQQYIETNQSRLTERGGFVVREIRAQSLEEAERVRHEVKEGKRDFAAVARLHSDAPNAERGGLTRYDDGQLPDVLEKAIKPLGPGDVSRIVESGYGFHIFKLERRIQPYPIDERRSHLDDRRQVLAEEIVARKNQQAIDLAVDRLVSAASIKIVDSGLGFTYSGLIRQN